MGLASIVLGILALLAMFFGIFFAWAPFVGALLSFGAFVLALAGLVTGGLALSRARQEGDSTGIPVAGLVVSGLAAIPSLFFALTCGLCNACLTAQVVEHGVDVQTFSDGGVVHRRVFGGFGHADAGSPLGIPPVPLPPSPPGTHDDPEPGAETPPGSPPPAFPPPPPNTPPDVPATEEAGE